MASSDPSGLASAAIAAFLILAAAPAPVIAQSNQQIPICEATGSQANPWVFTTIDARYLAEHLARGDFRANSIADCPGARAVGSATPSAAAATTPVAATRTPAVAQAATPVAAARTPAVAQAATRVAAARTPAVAQAATPATAQQQGGIGGGNPTSNVSVSQAVNTATATPAAATTLSTPTAVTASATAGPRLDVAGAQATPESQVSTLPKSGGEPDRPTLVLVLLGLIGVGAGLRRLGRSSPET
jgi:hypothetical protein